MRLQTNNLHTRVHGPIKITIASANPSSFCKLSKRIQTAKRDADVKEDKHLSNVLMKKQNQRRHSKFPRNNPHN